MPGEFGRPGSLPTGAMIGIVGGGQLGRMIALAARPMGYKIAILDPDPESPAGQVADKRIVADYADRDAARDLARSCDVLTYEFENVDAESIVAAGELTLMCPSTSVLRTAQNRVREKEAMQRLGILTARSHPVSSDADFHAALEDIGTPAVLKTAVEGYDGKGQVVIRSSEEGPAAYKDLAGRSPMLLLERFVSFKMEISVVCARDATGQTLAFPPSENQHVNGILDVTVAPARINTELARSAQELAANIADHLGVVGLIAVEMFVDEDDELLVNELAPRPHNSGHYTIEACRTSQFQQLVRILVGLPMGSIEMPRPAVMVNLLGELWRDTEDDPDWHSALSLPGVSLHLYGKTEARVGRKMGHLTVVAADVETALNLALEARDRAWRRAAD